MTLANPAISLVDTSEIEMTGVIDEIDIAMVKLGQESDVILDALPDKELKGKVTFISQIGTVEAGVVGYDTTVTLENPDEELRDGMSATAEIILDRRDDVLLIPNRAIRGSVENPTVAVAKAEQIRSAEDVESRQVTLGLSDGITTEVLSGLKEGERVVIASAKRVAPEGGF
jgi:HlyD family secretion protein